MLCRLFGLRYDVPTNVAPAEVDGLLSCHFDSIEVCEAREGVQEQGTVVAHKEVDEAGFISAS